WSLLNLKVLTDPGVEVGLACAPVVEGDAAGVGLGDGSSGFQKSGLPIPIGCAAPIRVPGAIAATFAASVMKTPALPACAPRGPTQTITGIFALSSLSTMSQVELTAPPGVSNSMIT